MAEAIKTPEQPENLFEIAITAFVIKDGKYLIIKRSADKKRFPSKWTIPGGKLEVTDFTSEPKDTEFYWYNVAEKVLKREVREEVGLEVDTTNMGYGASLATVHADGAPSFVLSFTVPYKSGEVKLQPEECVDFAWVTVTEAKDYDLIDGIYDELIMADNKLQGKTGEWQRFNP